MGLTQGKAKKAEPSPASFSLEPEVQTEVQTSHSKTLKDVSQEMKEWKDLRSEEINDLRSQVQTISKTLKAQLLDMKAAKLEACTKAEQLEAALDSEKAQIQNLREKLSEKENEAKKTLESTQASHQAQLEEHREETRKIASALKKAEDLLETERLCWQQEKISLLEETEKSRALYEDQLDEQKHTNDNLVAAPNSPRIQWQEEKTSLIQATEDLEFENKTLVAAVLIAEQKLKSHQVEWEEKERSMKSQLEELMSKEKKKNKWYRKFF